MARGVGHLSDNRINVLTGRWVEEHSLGSEHEPESGPMAACLEASATYSVPFCGSPCLAATPRCVGRYLFSVVEVAVGEKGCGVVGKPARRWAASGEVCCGKPGEGPASGCRKEGAENGMGGAVEVFSKTLVHGAKMWASRGCPEYGRSEGLVSKSLLSWAGCPLFGSRLEDPIFWVAHLSLRCSFLGGLEVGALGTLWGWARWGCYSGVQISGVGRGRQELGGKGAKGLSGTLSGR